jgi:hypothetical protein
MNRTTTDMVALIEGATPDGVPVNRHPPVDWGETIERMRIFVVWDRIILVVDREDVHRRTLPLPVTPLVRARVLPIDDHHVVPVETPDPGVIPVTAGEAAATATIVSVAVVDDLVRDRPVGTADPDPEVPNETVVVVTAVIVVIAAEAQVEIVNTTLRNIQTLRNGMLLPMLVTSQPLLILLNWMMHIRKCQQRKTLQRYHALPEKVPIVESLIVNTIVTGLEAAAEREDEIDTMKVSVTKTPTQRLLGGAEVATNEIRDDTVRLFTPRKRRESRPPERNVTLVKRFTLIQNLKGPQHRKESTVLPLITLMVMVLNEPGIRMVATPPTTNCPGQWLLIRTLSASRMVVFQKRSFVS